MKQLIILVLLCIAHHVSAQSNIIHKYTLTDKKALEIPDTLTKSTDAIARYIRNNFITDQDKARAAFIIVASNIEYDVAAYEIIKLEERTPLQLQEVLIVKKGICSDYAAVFQDICLKLNLKSYKVVGFVKENDELSDLMHAWNAVSIDTSWFLVDATWGAGYVNNGKFTKNIDFNHFAIVPSKAIENRYPFDHLWQLIEYPITFEDFKEGNIQNLKSATEYFNFKDSIVLYEKQSEDEQTISSFLRISKNNTNDPIFKRKFAYLSYYYYLLGTNKSVNEYNVFIDYYNKQFTPQKNDEEIKSLLSKPYLRLVEVKHKLQSMSELDIELASEVEKMIVFIETLQKTMEEKQLWLDKYMLKKTRQRKSMFRTINIWTGKPKKNQ